MPAGRPSEYTPALGNEIIELMATGLSLTAAAAELGFHRDTIYDWAGKYPEFSDACKKARGKRTLFLERRLLSADSSPVVTSSIFALKNACPDEWREKHEVGVTDKDGKDVPLATDALEVARKIAFIMARGAADISE